MAKSKSLKRQKFSGMQMLLVALVFGVVGGFIAWAAFAAPHKPGSVGGTGSGCAITPNQVTLDQIWTLNAAGLPSSGVNQIITFPDGAQSTGPITVGQGGTYTTTGNSNMSANWGFISPEQKGTYNYQFVGRVKWPAGTYTKLYASCSVVVQ